MAAQDTTVTVENGEKIDDEVETKQLEDEALDENQELDDAEKDTGKKDDEENLEDDDESNDNDDETKKKTESEFKKRFSQFDGETAEEYLKNLEDAYANSSTEGQRNAKEAKEAKERYEKVAAFVANNPDFAKALEEAEDKPLSKTVDPALAFARAEMEKAYERDWGSFVSLHPEVADDKELQNELINEMDLIAYAAEQQGRSLSMAEQLSKAWISLGRSAKDDKEKVVDKAKEQASKTTPAAKGKATVTKDSFTPEQIAVAKKMGLSPEDLAKYNKK